ncbi:transposase [uncultured Paraglaciecola sp.]|uniref:ISAon1 family transposase n=1 Tax=uncultured Paraglaciecola sp. TaxID=1765024 RepID=UPI0025ED14DB|nr:transposase [uncultured Paraglaciecola sp.]
MGKYLSLDETSLSNGELYTILTNKNAQGKKGAIVAIVKGTKASDVIHILDKIPLEKRNMVDEVTVDMAGSMNLIAKKCFPKTEIVTDRFHVQKLASEAVQEERIRLRWESIELENNAIQKARKEGAIYKAELLDNGDTQKQLLARSRYLLFKSKSKWTVRQIERAEILFKLYPTIEKAYDLAQGLSYIFENNTHKDTARLKLAHWYNKVEKSQFKSFNTISRSIQIHYIPILNYFNNRSTNASAESFNAKIKEFRAQFRGVRDVKFFLYRLTKLFA